MKIYNITDLRTELDEVIDWRGYIEIYADCVWFKAIKNAIPPYDIAVKRHIHDGFQHYTLLSHKAGSITVDIRVRL